MPDSSRLARHYLRASAAFAALAANALRPTSNPFLGIPSFFAAWLAAELAPHNLAITGLTTAAAAATGATREPAGKAGLVLSAAAAAGLGTIIVQSQRAKGVLEDALADQLGPAWPPPPADGGDREELNKASTFVANPFHMTHPDVTRVRDIQYHGTGQRGRLDVYLRKDRPAGAPVLLQIHGGAWVVGSKNDQGRPLMLHLAARGWVCVAINYPLSPKATWPEHLVACKRALAWIREHIDEYGGDPSFVAVTGGSAGGHLAAMMGLTGNEPEYQPGFEDADTSVQACIPFYGVYDLAATTGTPAVRLRAERFLAPTVFKKPFTGDNRPLYESASPTHRVRPDAPPFFVIHGANDSLVPVAEARDFVDKLRAIASSRVVYVELPGTQHAFEVFASIRAAHVIGAVERWLRVARTGVLSRSPEPEPVPSPS